MDEICDLDSDDRELFAAQLCTVGSLGRIIPGHALALLTKLLESRAEQFNNYLSSVKSSSGMCFYLISGLPNLPIDRTH